jgi:hypothetical protein
MFGIVRLFVRRIRQFQIVERPTSAGLPKLG